jgi:hypothetical protein
MQGDYPRFKTTYTHEELVEHFLLSPADRALIDTCYGDANRHGVAVLLKAVQYLLPIRPINFPLPEFQAARKVKRRNTAKVTLCL